MTRSGAPFTVVCSDLSENCLGRAQVLAEVLARFGPVQIVGPQLGHAVWPPARSSQVPISGIPLTSSFGLFESQSWLRQQLLGSRVVVTKPRSTSLGLALAAGVAPDKMLLDIDDWELGFMEPAERGVARAGKLLARGVDLLAPRSLNSYWAIRAFDWGSRRFPLRVVSNSWLKQRFGGVIVPHVRDTDRLDPKRHADARSAFRERAKFGPRPWVGFIGTIREHKGVEDLVAATAALQGDDAPGLLLAGVDFEHRFSKGVLEQARSSLPDERLRLIGAFDNSELPGWVAAVDVVCIPSRSTPGSWGQIPAKLFDAMAMARPVVAADVCDMGTILEGCGLTFPPGDVELLSQRLAELAQSPSQAQRLGAAARTRAVERYSVASAQQALAPLVAQLPVFEG
jgi:glycosyltransferase involved in cell wall biosynthesis